MCCASAPAYSDAISATTWRGRSEVSSAHSTTAPVGEVAAEPAGAAHDVARVDPVGPLAQLLQERAADVLLDLLARLLDGDLGQRGHGGEVQELDRLGLRPPRLEQHDAADPLVAGRDRHLGDDLGRHRRHAATALLADVAAHRGRGRPRRPADATATPSRGTTIATGPPAAPAARSATAASPSPVSTASSICRCTARSRSTSDVAAGGVIQVRLACLPA